MVSGGLFFSCLNNISPIQAHCLVRFLYYENNIAVWCGIICVVFLWVELGFSGTVERFFLAVFSVFVGGVDGDCVNVLLVGPRT